MPHILKWISCIVLAATLQCNNLHVLSFAPCNTIRPPKATSRLPTYALLSRRQVSSQHPSTSLHMIDPIDSNTILTAVETFDGSTIADPVVVSSVFWSSLQTKIFSVIIGQILATIVFAGLSFVVSSQLTNIGNFVSEKVFNERKNVKDTVGLMAENVKTKAQSPTVEPDFRKLLICLLVDIIGTSSELLPILGELTDVVWAPIAALTLRSLFQGSNVVFALEFAEEFLPLTDVLPLATICWIVETFYGDSEFAKTLQIGIYSKGFANEANGSSDVIDVPPVLDDEKRLPNSTKRM